MLKLVALAVFVVGCDNVFNLATVTLAPDASTTCTYAQLGTSGDADADGVPDATDACPTTAFEDPHDEDGDGIPDVCDRCPHLSETSVDADCDGIAAACDPDDMIVDEQQFLGLGTAAGLIPFQAVVENDSAHLLPAGVMYSEAIVDTRVASPATYELSGVIHDPQSPSLQTTSLIVRDADSIVATSPYIEATVQVMDGVTYFLIEKADATNVRSTPLGTFTGELPYTISILMTRDTVTAKLSGFATSTLVAPTSFYPAIEYGADAYRGDAAGTFVVDVHYLRRTAAVL